MFMSVWLLGYVISNIVHFNPNTKSTLDIINNLLSRRNVSLEMSARIRNYIKFIKSEKKDNEVIFPCTFRYLDVTPHLATLTCS
jgi:hypothetical protein